MVAIFFLRCLSPGQHCDRSALPPVLASWRSPSAQPIANCIIQCSFSAFIEEDFETYLASTFDPVGPLSRTQNVKLFFTKLSLHNSFLVQTAVHPHQSISHPSCRKFQPKWYILMSATSLVFLSRLSLPSTVSSTTNLQTTWAKRRQVWYLYQWTSKCSSLVVCGLGKVEKSQICEIRR